MNSPSPLLDALLDGRPVDWDAPSEDLAEADRRALAELGEVFAAFRTLSNEHASHRQPRPAVRMWGTLHLHEEIGRGASSVVYRITDPRLDRQAALKLLIGVHDLPEEMASTTGAHVVHEGRLVARVRHPNIVTVFGADVVDGTPGIWMELVEGRSLAAELGDRGVFSAREAALVGSEVCGALAALHQAGLLHRDIKPQNIMREHGGRIVLMDLGAGFETEAATEGASRPLAGTPLYMAPELFDGQPPSVSSDLYAVGALLYYLTTGRHPVNAESLAALRDLHARSSRHLLHDARPDLDARFVAIVETALQRDPARRPRSAGELRHQLTDYLSNQPATRSRLGNNSVALLLIVLALAVGIWIGAALRSRSGAVVADWNPTDPVPVSARKVAVYVPEQLDAAAAFEELAATALRDGRWDEALDRYEAARRIYATGRGPDTPGASVAIVLSGWVQLRAQRLAEARGLFELALIKLVQELGPDHPLVITTLTSLAVVEQRDRRFDAAAVAFGQAVAAYRRLLGITASTGTNSGQLPVSQTALARVLGVHAIDADDDRDWLSNAVEALLGTSPTSADSDGDGHSDAEGDADHDGWADSLQYGLACNPSGLLALAGAHDPADLGYRTSRPAESRPSEDGAGWVLRATQQSHYFRRFNSVHRQRASSEGFRMTFLGRARTGGTFFSLDLGTALGRFDMHLHDGRPSYVQFQTKAIPAQGPTFDLPGDRWRILQVVFDPRTGTGSVWIDGKKRVDGFRGHDQFLEGYGFMLGAANDLGRAPAGEGEFRLAMVEIR